MVVIYDGMTRRTICRTIPGTLGFLRPLQARYWSYLNNCNLFWAERTLQECGLKAVCIIDWEWRISESSTVNEQREKKEHQLNFVASRSRIVNVQNVCAGDFV
jgi:hypothetical protein